MKKLLSIVLTLIILQSQAFGQRGFVSFTPAELTADTRF